MHISQYRVDNFFIHCLLLRVICLIELKVCSIIFNICDGVPKSNKSSKKFSYKCFSSLFFTHSMFSFERQASLILFLQEVMSAEKEIEFQAAVRGFHYYRKY